MQHRPSLLRVFGLVVCRAHAALFIRKAFFDPVGIESGFVQAGNGGAPQIVYSMYGIGQGQAVRGGNIGTAHGTDISTWHCADRSRSRQTITSCF
ncbi:exported hypothetical protein [Burkholderia vietnamiensis]|nr:exported hypothetical protein [Burkholderia vietnamiensis]